ncbi:hypothetical protein K469DRAFT_699048 [Zopfia rhizophila CBS 207.26]|uniref:MOSC domain-containing protein n=1 Tax=Zopfia rhizophila CBS 207.26 TaxID=1314779 RepID=A0A6A6EV60_9PEZI|nr:hypothetical protein K469DRAFT_699048 [Zopfia rhizophila CBS 207.26]
MKISEIYVYPIKSLRGTSLSAAIATRHGFQYDRKFMLLKVHPDGFKNMAVSHFPEMTLFLTHIDYPEDDDRGIGSITVKFTAPGSTDTKTLTIPLLPNTQRLETIEINMHNSPTDAFKMPAEYNEWFSSCFGYEVLLVYLGDNLRDVLFQDLKPSKGSSWLSAISSNIPLLGASNPESKQITFADCAAYLIVSNTSLKDVSSRLSDGIEMDVTKFRPNIVIEGAESPWEEDFWGKIRINNAEFTLAHNCIRCKSINIDFKTGKQPTDKAGNVLKKLQADRRVDRGAKWSPVFGRYSYLDPRNGDRPLKVGDEVTVIRLNPERTVWSRITPRSMPQCSDTDKL